jgi:hypothetical protein
MYYDVEEVSKTTLGPPLNYGGDVYIGGDPWLWGAHDAKYDNIQVFNSPLTFDQVKALS